MMAPAKGALGATTIARTWRGWVRTEQAAAYVEYITRTGLSAYGKTRGNLGAQMWTTDLGDGRTPVTAQSGIYGSPETVPPPGALVFFNQTSAHDGHSQASGYCSHIELSLGDGNMISTADQTTVDSRWTFVHEETLAQHEASGAWNTYVGWWLPA